MLGGQAKRQAFGPFDAVEEEFEDPKAKRKKTRYVPWMAAI